MKYPTGLRMKIPSDAGERDRLFNEFWESVEFSDDGCWEWKGTIMSSGYGVFPKRSEQELAHRLSYFICNGRLEDGLFVIHSCDNRKCVSPYHMRLGTNAANLRDMAEKGRSTWGEKNPRAKLTQDEVREIRRRAEGGETHQRIADSISVSRSLVGFIVNRDIWKRLN